MTRDPTGTGQIGADRRRAPSRATLILGGLVVILAAAALWSSRSLPPSVRLGDGLEVRCLNSSVWPTADSGGEGFPLTVAGHEIPEIRVVSDRPLSFLTLEFERRSAASIELEGGRVAERILRPDGRVRFRIVPDPVEASRHVWPFSGSYRYRLVWVMPGGPGGPLGFTVHAEPQSAT